MRGYLGLMEQELAETSSRRLCRDTLLSGAQFLVDIREWGYQDARLVPHGVMTEKTHRSGPRRSMRRRTVAL